LTRQDLCKRVSLSRVGALIDHHLHRAVAFVDRAGPNGHGHGAQAVKLDVAKMALFNLESGNVPAIAMRGEGVELARTTVGTVAIGELCRFDFPFNGYRHAALP
jgi:hypothetical protein